MEPTDRYDHLVCFNSQRRFLEIYRVETTGRKVFYTEVSYDDARKFGFEEFARLLGENIIIDSGAGRTLFP
jgi:hypothetical protein